MDSIETVIKDLRIYIDILVIESYRAGYKEGLNEGIALMEDGGQDESGREQKEAQYDLD